MASEDYELIITEKPKVSQRIAQALADGEVEKTQHGSVNYYILTRKGRKIIVAPAVGHVFTLVKEPGQYDYPIFNIHWTPSYEARSSAKYTKAYVDTIKYLAKDASSVTCACDYDIEGELIGYNVIKFLIGDSALDKAARMKFSALTQEELEKAYDGREEHLDFNLANAGITRHILDWYWGINTSRALSHSYKSVTGRYVTLSAGRVQTPTLKVLDDRELEIKKFVPEPFWLVTALLENGILTIHDLGNIFDKKKAAEIHKSCKGKDALVKKVQKRKFKQQPPTPFNLGDLQSEAYRVFKYSPRRTQITAQNLYEQGLISYPRTSSQKLPKGVDPKKIIEKLSKQNEYKTIAGELLSEKKLKANEGKKTDPAHPCIHPTGEFPKKLPVQDWKLYDLIVKRFLATFGKPAVRETHEISFNINNEDFNAKGTRTIEENWHHFYKPYVRLKEEELPEVREGEVFKVEKLKNEEKETQPPKRYSQAAIVKKMEQLGIGTKATRATILQTLYDRNYIEGTQLKVTEFGSKIIETIEKHAPELASEQLTRNFEEEVKQIRAGEKEKDVVIEEAKISLAEIFKKFKEHSEEIGKSLVESYAESEKKRRTLGPCPRCEKGELIIRVSRKSGKQFVGCSAYPNCDCSYPLPQGVLVVKAKKPCEHDNLPVIEVKRRGRRGYKMCIDPKCKSKADWGKKKKKKAPSKSSQ